MTASSVLDGLRPGGRYADWSASAPALVLCDVDGTLVGAGRLPSAPVAAAIAAAQDAGLAVGLATGREWRGAGRIARACFMSGPHVVHNGAEIRLGDGTVAERQPLSYEAGRALAHLSLLSGWYTELYVGDGFYVTDRREAARPHWDLLEMTPDGLVEELDLDRNIVVKATVIVFDRDTLAKTVAAIEGIGLAVGVGVAPRTPGLIYLNVTRADVDKGWALRAAGRAVGVGPDAVAAVGDGLNDLPLLAAAGTAVAMGQAPEQVQAGAHLVAPSVSGDGAAAAISALARLRRARGVSATG